MPPKPVPSSEPKAKKKARKAAAATAAAKGSQSKGKPQGKPKAPKAPKAPKGEKVGRKRGRKTKAEVASTHYLSTPYVSQKPLMQPPAPPPVVVQLALPAPLPALSAEPQAPQQAAPPVIMQPEPKKATQFVEQELTEPEKQRLAIERAKTAREKLLAGLEGEIRQRYTEAVKSGIGSSFNVGTYKAPVVERAASLDTAKRRAEQFAKMAGAKK